MLSRRAAARRSGVVVGGGVCVPCSLLTKVNTASEGEGRKKRAGEGREGEG